MSLFNDFKDAGHFLVCLVMNTTRQHQFCLEPKTHQSPHLNKLTDEKFMNGNINRHYWKANGKLREEFYSLFFKYEQLFFFQSGLPLYACRFF